MTEQEVTKIAEKMHDMLPGDGHGAFKIMVILTEAFLDGFPDREAVTEILCRWVKAGSSHGPLH